MGLLDKKPHKGRKNVSLSNREETCYMKKTMGKQLLALLVAFLMVFNGFAMTTARFVYAANGDKTVLAFTSDVHNNESNNTGKTRLGSEGVEDKEATFENGAALGHKFGNWTKLNNEQHQRVCTNDASHVEKANHVWDNGTVTEKATLTTTGKKLHTCAVCGVTKTSSIAKVSLGKAKVASEGKPNRKLFIITMSKVSGASAYKIMYRTPNGKWATKTTSKTKFNLTGLKVKGLYQIKAQATKKETATTKAVTGASANVNYRYLNTIKNYKIKSGSKSATLSWSKDSYATGYQIIYSTNKNIKNAKVLTLKGNSNTKRIVKGLKKGKIYYFRVRPIKRYGGKDYIGVLSPIKAVKIK